MAGLVEDSGAANKIVKRLTYNSKERGSYDDQRGNSGVLVGQYPAQSSAMSLSPFIPLNPV